MTHDLPFFDCNAFVGRGIARQPGAPETADELLREMDRLGIEEALVYPAWARLGAAMEGNEALEREIAGRERLHACWVLLPHQTGEMLEPARLVAEMREGGVRAARVFPNDHMFSLAEWCFGPVAAALEEAGIPLLVDSGRKHWRDACTDWEVVRGLCRAHPRLKVILVREGVAANRWLYPLLGELPNLFVEISYYQTHAGLDEIARRFGAERLLFGTGMPTFAAGAPMAAVLCSELSDAQKRLVAGDGLRRMLGVTAE